MLPTFSSSASRAAVIVGTMTMTFSLGEIMPLGAIEVEVLRLPGKAASNFDVKRTTSG